MACDTDVMPVPAPRIAMAGEPQFQHIGRNVDKLVEQVRKGYFNFRPNDTWQPSVNLYETDETYLVCVDLAGVDKQTILVEVLDNRLTLRGSRDVPTYHDGDAAEQAGKVRVHVMEIDHGAFFREVEVPDAVDQDRIAAQHRNGLLWIELPKR